jgi:hypothetical protein
MLQTKYCFTGDQRRTSAYPAQQDVSQSFTDFKDRLLYRGEPGFTQQVMPQPVKPED